MWKYAKKKTEGGCWGVKKVNVRNTQPTAVIRLKTSAAAIDKKVIAKIFCTKYEQKLERHHNSSKE